MFFFKNLDAVKDAQGTNEGTNKSDDERAPNTRRETWHIAVERNERCCRGLAIVEAATSSTTSQVSAIGSDRTRVIREGTGVRVADALSLDRIPKGSRAVGRKAETGSLAVRNLLRWVWIVNRRFNLRATITGIEGEIRKSTMREQAVLISGHTITDFQ